MDVARLVAECIIGHLPRDIHYIDIKTAGLYNSRDLTYSSDAYGNILASITCIPLDVIKALRLVHPTFAALFDVYDLYLNRQVDLFRTQYSAIMLGNHVFDMRWCAFPADSNNNIYRKWRVHEVYHNTTHGYLASMVTYGRTKLYCDYCVLVRQELMDSLRRPLAPRKFAGDEMWDVIRLRERRQKYPGARHDEMFMRTADFLHHMALDYSPLYPSCMRAENIGTHDTSGKNGVGVRYANYIGGALVRKVKFEVNGSPLDEYTPKQLAFRDMFNPAAAITTKGRETMKKAGEYLKATEADVTYGDTTRVGQTAARGIRTSAHTGMLAHGNLCSEIMSYTPEGERVGIVKHIAPRRATASDLGIPSKREQKRERKRR